MAAKTVTLTAVATVACLLPAAACSSSLPQNAPAMPPPTPATASASAETTIERAIRFDQESAVTAYRKGLAESDRLFMAGGAEGATSTLKDYATGPYLAFVTDQLRQVAKSRWRSSGRSKIVYAAAQGWTQSAIHVKACEDDTGARLVDEAGKDQTPAGHRRYVQDYEVTKSSDGWKVRDVDSMAVASFVSYGCQR